MSGNISHFFLFCPKSLSIHLLPPLSTIFDHPNLISYYTTISSFTGCPPPQPPPLPAPAVHHCLPTLVSYTTDDPLPPSLPPFLTAPHHHHNLDHMPPTTTFSSSIADIPHFIHHTFSITISFSTNLCQPLHHCPPTISFTTVRPPPPPSTQR